MLAGGGVEINLYLRTFARFFTQQTSDSISADFSHAYCGKIIWNRISNELCFSYDEAGYYVLDSMFMITSPNGLMMKYLLATLNSSIAKHWIKNNAATLGNGIYGAKIYIEKLPIPKITESNRYLVDSIIALVEEILSLKACHAESSPCHSEVLAEESLGKEPQQTKRDISAFATQKPQYDKNNSTFDTTALESQIDKLVYKLYKLNDEEIKIIKIS
ncbi:hypothetical protein K4G57_01850 [Helicobacter sp. Faydin-H70]|uniref:site-specific DNA-methyltransferase (adenine-specific) n=1 Tax=Helicobacter turcicus TaxID=2867412 RepID=A0ABS7JLF8_9HELI|nr:hypothetical protein [Helicobacter turcicus]